MIKELLIGAAAGATATIPMSWAMEVMHRLLPSHESHPLPPRLITDRLLKKAGVSPSREERLWAALAAHLGYGAAVGALYQAAAHNVPGRPLAKGTFFGILVWAGSYLGLLPGVGLLAPITRHPARRTAVMIIAHLVWGSALAVFSDLLARGSKGEHPGFLGAKSTTPIGAKQYA